MNDPTTTKAWRPATRRAFFLIVLVTSITGACTMFQISSATRQQYRDALVALDLSGVRYLKAHLTGGDLLVFAPPWTVDTQAHAIAGTAVRYDMERNAIHRGAVSVPLGSISIMETNEPLAGRDRTFRGTLITIGVIDAAMTTFCALNPKACFGSCPTFYFPGDSGVFQARAEGFSSAIYPALQYADIDQLGIWTRTRSPLEITMKNEALETHVVDHLQLHAFPVRRGEEVRLDPQGRFQRCGTAVPCAAANYQGSDVCRELANDDGVEWWSRAAADDLRSEAHLDLTFEHSPARPALALTFRQTLLTTYLLYTALGYMGRECSDMIAQLQEDETLRRRSARALEGLQDLRVQVLVDGEWIDAGTVHETGPIARNRIVVPLPAELSPQLLRVRLSFTPGMYRVDQAALVGLLGEAGGELLPPIDIVDARNCPVKGVDAVQQSDERKFSSLPGDVSRITFQHPSQPGPWQLFLEAEGYYLEWMREEWRAATDVDRLYEMLRGDDRVWRELTREFKGMEEGMDAVFWNSQYPTPL